MPEHRRHLLVLLGAAAALPASAAPAVATKDPAPRACSMALSLVSLRVVDAGGAPVAGARMRVRRVSTQRELPGAGPIGQPGDYKILEDGDLPDLAAAGEDFDIELQKDTRTQRVRVRIGLDAQGCHAVLLRGNPRVVL